MSQREFDREIPPDQQLREVSLILMQALYRIKRHGPPPRPPSITTSPATPTSATNASRPRKQTLPKACHTKHKPGTYENQLKNLFKKRMPQKQRWWLEMVVSIHAVPCEQLNRAACRTHPDTHELEFRDAFDHAMRVLAPDDRRIAALVATHGITHMAREVGMSWCRVAKALTQMRAAFEEAGF